MQLIRKSTSLWAAAVSTIKWPCNYQRGTSCCATWYRCGPLHAAKRVIGRKSRVSISLWFSLHFNWSVVVSSRFIAVVEIGDWWCLYSIPGDTFNLIWPTERTSIFSTLRWEWGNDFLGNYQAGGGGNKSENDADTVTIIEHILHSGGIF